ncbi:hypothetical protein HMPREF9104_02562 [Lentilactobacillus kisonensis F0435]|uniref:Uncharacterized protein n=1 Tax=Lentilactobacillus kisonensis F0435 TaxID=797516 RepID=H1LIX0_9LACO|nr:hypothetical protein HMPREF9104_02562 [Lentilactobacillus kisonensis F0435]
MQSSALRSCPNKYPLRNYSKIENNYAMDFIWIESVGYRNLNLFPDFNLLSFI